MQSAYVSCEILKKNFHKLICTIVEFMDTNEFKSVVFLIQMFLI